MHRVEATVGEVLDFLGDRALGHRGALERAVSGSSALAPGRPECLAFASRRSDTLVATLRASVAGLVLVFPEHLEAARDDQCVIAVADPRLEFARVVAHFFVARPEAVIHPTAVIDPAAIVGPDAAIGAHAYVGPGVAIGARAWIGANAVIDSRTQIGDDVVVGPGTVIGHTGFGYAREADGTPVLLPHTGSVRIGDRVDIGANTTIDRGTLDDTVIEDDAKIDNLVHVAHNVQIGRGAFVIATSILCGGVKVGAGAWVAPNASVLEQVTIGDDAVVGLAATVIRDVESGTTVVGSPARAIGGPKAGDSTKGAADA